jgi:hypothetical protein
MIALLWQWRKVIALAAVVICISLIGWRVSAWHTSHKALPGVQAALEAEEACGEGSKCDERQKALQAAQAAVTEQVVKGYEQELADIRSKPIPTRVIRVCRQAGTGGVRVPADPGEPAGTAPAGVVSGTDEFDTRPLRELARRADEVSSGYRWLRSRDEALSTPPVE